MGNTLQWSYNTGNFLLYQGYPIALTSMEVCFVSEHYVFYLISAGMYANVMIAHKYMCINPHCPNSTHWALAWYHHWLILFPCCSMCYFGSRWGNQFIIPRLVLEVVLYEMCQQINFAHCLHVLNFTVVWLYLIGFTWGPDDPWQPFSYIWINCQIFNIRHTLSDNKIFHHPDVVGAPLVGAAPTTSSLLT